MSFSFPYYKHVASFGGPGPFQGAPTLRMNNLVY